MIFYFLLYYSSILYLKLTVYVWFLIISIFSYSLDKAEEFVWLSVYMLRSLDILVRFTYFWFCTPSNCFKRVRCNNSKICRYIVWKKCFILLVLKNEYVRTLRTNLLRKYKFKIIQRSVYGRKHRHESFRGALAADFVLASSHVVHFLKIIEYINYIDYSNCSIIKEL